LVLASASPRRRDLLEAAGVGFVVDPSGVDESSDERDPERLAEELARRKAVDVARRRPGAFVLGADTVVCVGDQLLGKPTDEACAARMLATLSGSTHQVVTGVCVVAPDASVRVRSEVTLVRMRMITEAERENYMNEVEAQKLIESQNQKRKA